MPDIGKDFLAVGALGRQDEVLLRAQRVQADLKSVTDSNGLAKSGKIDPKIEKAATEFEALLLQQMLQSMWKSAPSEGMLTGSNEESLYRDMLSEQLAKEMAESQSLGLKDIVIREMTEKAEGKDK